MLALVHGRLGAACEGLDSAAAWSRFLVLDLPSLTTPDRDHM